MYVYLIQKLNLVPNICRVHMRNSAFKYLKESELMHSGGEGKVS